MASHHHHHPPNNNSQLAMIRTIRVLVAGTGVTYKISLPLSDLT